MADANGASGGDGPKPLNDLLSHLPTTIFTVMSALAVKHNSVNLGQVRTSPCCAAPADAVLGLNRWHVMAGREQVDVMGLVRCRSR